MKNFIFELLYYGLSGVLFLILLYTAYRGFVSRRGITEPKIAHQAWGLGCVALGLAIALLGGVSLDTLMKSGVIGDLFYQQVHFSIFYLGFGLIVYGIVAAAWPANQNDPARSRIRLGLWVLYVLSVIVAAYYLFVPSALVITVSGGVQHVAQQPIYFVPLFFTLLVELIAIPFLARNSSRKVAAWWALFVGLVLVGLLREATVIPSTGEPILDLLLAFGPFTLGGLCLWMSLRTLLSSARAGNA